MKFYLAAILLACIGTPSFAQDVYKCSNTYSQTPCADGVKKMDVEPAMVPDCKSSRAASKSYCVEQRKIKAKEKNQKEQQGKDQGREKESLDKIKKQMRIEEDIRNYREKLVSVKSASEKVNENIEKCKENLRFNSRNSVRITHGSRVGVVNSENYGINQGPLVAYLIEFNANRTYRGHSIDQSSSTWLCFFDLEEEKIKHYVLQ